MDSQAETIKLQDQVRQNADEFRNTLDDLCTWTKDIKDKEKNLKKHVPYDKNQLKTIPIRGGILAKAVQNLAVHDELANLQANNNEAIIQKSDSSVATTNAATDVHAQANKIKDKGNSHVKRGEYELAITAYTQAIEMYPQDVVYYCNRALCYLKLECYEDSIKDCNLALKINKQTVKALYRRMQANESLGNLLGAYNDCKAVLEIDPNNKDAKNSLERINARLGKNNNGPNFKKPEGNWIYVETTFEQPHKRSTSPLVKIKVESCLTDKEKMEIAAKNLDIPDDDVDKIFNSNCGPYIEIKKPINASADKKAAAPHLPSKSKKKTSKVSEPAETRPTINKEIKIPKKTTEFYATWTELSMSQKYDYLTRIELKNLVNILGAGFDFQILTDILNIIRDFYLPNKNPNTLALMQTVLKHPQMGILSGFISAEDKVLQDIFTQLENNAEVSKTECSILKKGFGLKSVD